MEYTNGYFQLEIKADGTYIILYPQKKGGNSISINEVSAYLEKNKIYDYNIKELNEIIKNISEVTSYKVTDQVINECNETSIVKVSKDRLYAIIRLYPPSTKGKLLEKKDIIGDLQREKIKFGTSEKIIEYILNNKQYCKDMPIAKAKMPVEGKHASIKYHFNTTPTATPTLLEDGSVDFHKLNIFSTVKKNEVLATLTPAIQGKDGVDVYGNRLLPLKVKNLALKYGKNIAISEDKLTITSLVDGDAKLEASTVFVSDTYTVAADVDASTGDVEYEGNVIIAGNVRTGFTVKAKGDIEVKGVVEGANIIAGGNIVLKRGMQGMSKGRLEAGEDIITKFIESGNIVAGGSVNAGSILHSNIEAGDKVVVSGRKGFIIGGSIIAKNIIEAHSIGNQMGTVTNLRVGIDAKIIEEAKVLEKNIDEYNAQKLKVLQNIAMLKKRISEGKKLSNDQTKFAKEATIKLKEIEEGIAVANKRLEECDEIIGAKTVSKIVVSGSVYSGVRIVISNGMYNIKEERRYCQFRLDGGIVVVNSL